MCDWGNNFKFQTEVETILGGIGGKEHVNEIRANAKLTKSFNTDMARITK